VKAILCVRLDINGTNDAWAVKVARCLHNRQRDRKSSRIPAHPVGIGLPWPRASRLLMLSCFSCCWIHFIQQLKLLLYELFISYCMQWVAGAVQAYCETIENELSPFYFISRTMFLLQTIGPCRDVVRLCRLGNAHGGSFCHTYGLCRNG